MHISIKHNPRDPSETAIVVDGQNITKSVLADGFGVEFSEDAYAPAVVHLRLVADTLDVDMLDGAMVIDGVEVF